MKSEQSLIEMFSRVHGTWPFGADAEVVQFRRKSREVSRPARRRAGRSSAASANTNLCSLSPLG